MSQLRTKLGDDAARPAFIFNERGVPHGKAGRGVRALPAYHTGLSNLRNIGPLPVTRQRSSVGATPGRAGRLAGGEAGGLMLRWPVRCLLDCGGRLRSVEPPEDARLYQHRRHERAVRAQR